MLNIHPGSRVGAEAGPAIATIARVLNESHKRTLDVVTVLEVWTQVARSYGSRIVWFCS